MKYRDILDYLDQKFEKLNFDGDINMNWDKKSRSIEIEMVFYAQNSDNTKISDIDGVESENEIISFADAILLYDGTKQLKVNQDDYLVTLPFNGKKGWKLSEGEGFIDYLQTLLDDGQSDLLDFLSDDTQSFFNLTWSNDAYLQSIQHQKMELAAKDLDIKYPKF